MARSRRCVMCGRANVTLWTLDNLSKATVAYLCKDDAAPLAAIMEAAGGLPPDQQIPLTERHGNKEPIDLTFYARGRRKVDMAPLDWTPPTPPA